MNKSCTGCPADGRPICETYAPEPSEMDDRGNPRLSGYCETCGHAKECHEPVVDAE